MPLSISGAVRNLSVQASTLLLPTVLEWKMDGWGFLGPMPTEVVMAADAIYRLCYLFGLYFAMYDDI